MLSAMGAPMEDCTVYVDTTMTEVRVMKAPSGMDFEELARYVERNGWGDLIDIMDEVNVVVHIERADGSSVPHAGSDEDAAKGTLGSR